MRHENYYMQVLEGRKSDVIKLARKISTDKRHGNFLLVHSTSIQCRMFDKWSMASATLTESEWKKWIAAFSGGKRQVDKLITAFVDGFYRK